MDGVWLQKLADWAWLLVVAIGAAVIRLFQRVAVLEGSHDERTRQLHEINGKIDKLTEKVDDNHNMIISKLIERVPKP